ncbi:MAG TPA: hypothetical protein VHJ20_22570 [Polyangia bacterium]|nr:hypothetical protein [Polyangia bacterium]
MRTLGTVALALGLLASGAAHAQDRPSDADMFGGGDEKAGAPAAPAPAQPPAAAPAAAAPAAGDDRDQSLLTGGALPEHLSDYQAPDNPLSIGGQLYLRAQSSAQQSTHDAWTLTAPSLLDLYLDARPNPRVRAFILGRMSFDPTAAPGTSSSGLLTGSNGGALAGGSATGFSSFTTARGPTSILDQMWIRFDVANRAFITAGKQHVRWGTGRFWQPTDYLHPVKRNPLDVFDARPGQTMLKLHVPVESLGWNFYGFGIFEDPNQASNELRDVAGGARAELVILGAEIGLDTLLKDGQRPRFGVDLSTGIWELDVYADVGLRFGDDFTVVQRVPLAEQPTAYPCNNVAGATTQSLSSQYELAKLSGFKTQAVGGVNWSHKYNDNDMFTLGAEYFYNQPGYSDTSLYPGLLFNTSGQPQLNFFYTGRHYGAVFASFPAPYSWNLTTFTFSTLANLTDQSYISRVDYSYTLLTHISLEAFVGVHYGSSGGEFRLGFDDPQYSTTASTTGPAGAPPAADVPCNTTPFHRDPSLLDLGVALRVKI